MKIISSKILSNFKIADSKKNQSRKMLILATANGAGTVISVLTGFLLNQISSISDSFYWGTFFASLVIVPLSNIFGLHIWDKLRVKWSKSEEFIEKLHFLENEFQRSITLLKSSGLKESVIQKNLEKLYDEYRKAEFEVILERKNQILGHSSLMKREDPEKFLQD